MSLEITCNRRLGAFLLTVGAFFAIGTAPAIADTIADPAGDFLPSYTGAKNGDLDVLSAEVSYTGSNFRFSSTENAPIGTTPTGIFVWGINRGAGTQGFPVIAPGVTFDTVFVINPSGSSVVRDLINGTATPISDITISGANISALVPASALPSEGFDPANYLVNLWPRDGSISGDPAVADFAPDNSDAAVTNATPEPATFSIVGLFLLSGMTFWRHRQKRTL